MRSGHFSLFASLPIFLNEGRLGVFKRIGLPPIPRTSLMDVGSKPSCDNIRRVYSLGDKSKTYLRAENHDYGFTVARRIPKLTKSHDSM